MGQGIGCSYCNNEPGNIPVQKSDFPFNNYEIIENYRFKSNIKTIQTESYYDKNNTKTLNTDSNINYEKLFDENILKVATIISDNDILLLTKNNFKNLEKNFNKNDYTLIDYSNLIKKEITYKFKVDNSIYKGSWNKNGKKEGFGIYINPSNDIYIGYFLNDLFNGKGKLINSNEDYFEGYFINGKAEGNGKLILKKDKYSYEGQFKNDLPNGFGKENFNNINLYEGNFLNGKKEGEGIFKWKDGSMYKGNFNKGNINGNGIFNWQDGRIYKGEFLNGEIEGKGEFIWPNNHKYIGSYIKGKKNGFGIYYWNNDIFYEGNWVNNSQHGEGIFSNGLRRIKGIFRFGKLIQCSENKKIRKNNLRITFALPDKNIIQKELHLDNNSVNEILGNTHKSEKNIPNIKSCFAGKIVDEN